jgi:hypothetical protein
VAFGMAELRRDRFGRWNETVPEDQLLLGLDCETIYRLFIFEFEYIQFV